MKSGKQQSVFHCREKSAPKHRGPASFQRRLFRDERREPEHVMSMLLASQKPKLRRQIPSVHYWRWTSGEISLRTVCFLSSISLVGSTGNMYLSRRTCQRDLWGFFVFRAPLKIHRFTLKNSHLFSCQAVPRTPESVALRAGSYGHRVEAAAIDTRSPPEKGFSVLHAGLCQGFIFHKVVRRPLNGPVMHIKCWHSHRLEAWLNKNGPRLPPQSACDLRST